jgi:hypothetical protein
LPKIQNSRYPQLEDKNDGGTLKEEEEEEKGSFKHQGERELLKRTHSPPCHTAIEFAKIDTMGAREQKPW